MCTKRVTKVFLILTNSVLIVVGFALLGIGIIVIGTTSASKEKFLENIHGYSSLIYVSHYDSSTSYVIILNVIMIIVCCLGYHGIRKEIKCLLFSYCIFLLILIILQIAFAIFLAMTYPKMIKYNTKTHMTQKFLEHKPETIIGGSIRFLDRLSQAWVEIQYELECCGVISHLDYEKIEWEKKYELYDNTIIAKVPPSCCKFEKMQKLINGSKLHGAHLEDCLTGKDHFNSKGCYTALEEVMKITSLLSVSAISVIIVFEIMSTILALYLWKKIDE